MPRSCVLDGGKLNNTRNAISLLPPRPSYNLKSYPMQLLLVALPLLGLAWGVGAQSCAYVGGWALRNAGDCPPSAPVRCNAGLQPRCCPSGQVCTGVGAYEGNYCCAPGEDCTRKAEEAPKCPDPTWSLWGVDGSTNNGGWCCLPSANGTFVRRSDNTIAVGCNPVTAPLPQSQIWASRLSAVASCAPTSQPSTTQSSSTQTSPPPQSPPPVQAPESHALSSGAIAGIVVGATIGGGLLAVLAVGIVIFRRKRSRMYQAESDTATQPSRGAYDDQKTPYSLRSAELAVPTYYEMSQMDRPQEMGFGAPIEMGDPSTLREAELGDGRPQPGH
ncbi:hypothetical protein MAPG_03645 [Magnaporthiopsis poae ATCC 64411]|uniref:Uncharacterized protein n=1 Tax=Magnaporthiopsis poae (strain ATCC 64411 / 73-15) TaxID=644358 RepID=A0A0C4DUK5_MAGP6|nr:hypothetical protein MAPG_03645 [Magnaporthiopsis poae ATCC 64411]